MRFKTSYGRNGEPIACPMWCKADHSQQSYTPGDDADGMYVHECSYMLRDRSNVITLSMVHSRHGWDTAQITSKYSLDFSPHNAAYASDLMQVLQAYMFYAVEANTYAWEAGEADPMTVRRPYVWEAHEVIPRPWTAHSTPAVGLSTGESVQPA
ncbi:hypothetical protein [Trueperella sp. LYQ143]|uniref:hypothetical protein n=1 Tax=Trueperella sp. LYQ143 TaxID=3391059 RepID=UPI00398315EF